MLTLKFDVFSWIPGRTVFNPLHLLSYLPSLVAREHSGKYFRGDDLVDPPSTPEAIRSFRAKQTFTVVLGEDGRFRESAAEAGGDVVPGVTIVQQQDGADNRFQATVLDSEANVRRIPYNYDRVHLRGAAQDPVPALAVERATFGYGGSLGQALTPNLAWEFNIDILKLDDAARMGGPESSKDYLDKLFSAPTGNHNNCIWTIPTSGSFLITGKAYTKQFPSYILYITITENQEGKIVLAYYFYNAAGYSAAYIAFPYYRDLRPIWISDRS